MVGCHAQTVARAARATQQHATGQGSPIKRAAAMVVDGGGLAPSHLCTMARPATRSSASQSERHLNSGRMGWAWGGARAAVCAAAHNNAVAQGQGCSGDTYSRSARSDLCSEMCGRCCGLLHTREPRRGRAVVCVPLLFLASSSSARPKRASFCLGLPSVERARAAKNANGLDSISHTSPLFDTLAY